MFYTRILRPFLFVLGLGLSVSSCIEAFEPKLPGTTTNYLVVDGFINLQGRTRIRLSRTVPVSGQTASPAETKAQLYIEQEAGQRYPLREISAGNYQSDSLQLINDKRYRLYFKTAGQREYASDYTAGRITPALDSISWKVQREGLQLYANTHDPSNQTRYYRWDYAETWEYTTPWVSLFEYKRPNNFMDRKQLINHCWNTTRSADLNVSNTLKLSQDVVAEYPLRLIDNASTYKVNEKYSIVVRQYAQTAEEYSYWETLKKNTENIGTLFDPLPTQLTGNVRSLSEPGEAVIGYVGTFSVAEKRLFLSRAQLPEGFTPLTGYEACAKLDTVLNDPENQPNWDVLLGQGFFVLVNYDGKGYYFASPDCADCRKRGGTLQRPAFWR